MLADILILSNGPGEVTTWVRPVVKALRLEDTPIRISVVLSPCPNATGKEAAIARSYPEVDRVQAAEHFFPFLLWGKTADNWEWSDRGVVIFLGGDQFFPVVISKRLGYRSVIYAEWKARWLSFVDAFGVMKSEVINQVPQKYADKFTVVGDLMADVGDWGLGKENGELDNHLIGLLPGSKAAKLAQGVPLTLAIAEYIHQQNPHTRFIIPVAPTVDLSTLARFANSQENPIIELVKGTSAELVTSETQAYLKTAKGLIVELYTDFPAYELLTKCSICLTTVGANTAELGALAVPMIVLLPTQQLDAMRSWDGLPGIVANLPVVGSLFAKLINSWVLRKKRLFSWANIWANAEIVPELVGKLEAKEVADLVLDYLEHPEKLKEMRSRLKSVRGETGAATKLAQLSMSLIKD